MMDERVLQTMDDLTCGVPGCEDPRKGDQPLCAPHWYRAPRRLRQAYWDAAPESAARTTALAHLVAAVAEVRP